MQNKKKTGKISPSLIAAVVVIILGLSGMYLSFYLAYRDFALRADDGAVMIRDLSRIREMLTALFWQLQLSVLMVVSGICVLMVRLYGNAKKRDEIREQLTLLEQENRAVEALMEKNREMEHLQRLEMIGTMTSGIAHEFNNMLTPIMGYSLLSMDMIDPQNTELIDNLNEIYNASSKAQKMIRRLSELSGKESSSEFLLLSPDEILLKTEAMYQVTFPENVTLEKDYHCPEKCIRGDETQLSQVVLNLVINAVQAMKKKGGTLLIRTRKEEQQVFLIFEDTGPGISEENQKKIFDPFFTTRKNGNGTGLGLAIARHIMTEHHGDITVQSELGKGTRFTMILPLVTE